jgi:trehalose-phosphatase
MNGFDFEAESISTKECPMKKVNALFLDYDGTISPLEVPRQQSRVPPHLEGLLNVMNQFVPIGIITTKDLPFILPRTLFAHAWCAIAGLENKVGSKLFISKGVEESLPHLIQALIFAKQNAGEEVLIEEKCDYRGLPLAFCVDWRNTRDEKKARHTAAYVKSFCDSLPLQVIDYPGRPYYDVFPVAINKGQAVNWLKEKIAITGGILYMGDSTTDNAAFRESDISIGVSRGRQPTDLDCKYWINFTEVPFFLSCLFKNKFAFNSDLPGIKVRTA